MDFVQIIEFTTTRADEMRTLSDDFQAQTAGQPGAAGSVILTADRDNPGRFLVIAQFASYEEAMENSNRPEVSAFAQAMAELCDGPPSFRNLDVVERMEG